MQYELLNELIIPDENGKISQPGYARKNIYKYTRENIKAPWFRKKEWDYYLFTNEKFGLAFTISDLGYVGLLSVSFLDFVSKTEHTETDLVFLPRDKKFGLGVDVFDGDAKCETKRLKLEFVQQQGKRLINCVFQNFDNDKDFSCELEVFEPECESMYICTPWKEKETAFYYNCKMNNLEAQGHVKYGDREEVLDRDTTLGVLDWGRGVWTYDNTWFWGTGSGRVNGKPFGFNIGYGFSDRSSASENVLYYDGKIHKLEEVDFGIPKKDNSYQFMDTWNVTSSDNRFFGTFTPIIDRCANMDFKVIVSDQHQVFGKFNGKAILDNGETLEINDFICALEVVRNKY